MSKTYEVTLTRTITITAHSDDTEEQLRETAAETLNEMIMYGDDNGFKGRHVTCINLLDSGD